MGLEQKLSTGLLGYGGSKVLNDFGAADGWKKLLQYCVDKKAAKVSPDGKRVLMRWTREGHDFLGKLQVSREATIRYKDCRNMDQ